MRKLHMLLVALIATFLVVATLLGGMTTTARAQEATWPDGFCDNEVGVPYNADSPLPVDDPCPEGTTYEVEFFEYALNQRVEKVWPLDWNEVVTAISGKVWAHPAGQKGFDVDKDEAYGREEAGLEDGMGGDTTTGEQPTATNDDELMKLVEDVELGVCAKEDTREARLDCATKFYFDHGEKLVGFAAYMRSLGATWENLAVGDPFQPDAIPLGKDWRRVWGGVVKATNLTVTGKSCLVTDVATRIAEYGWVYEEPAFPRNILHAGDATTAGTLTEIAYHADCSDWPEIVAAMNGSTSEVQQPIVDAPADQPNEPVIEPADVITKTVVITETVYITDTATVTFADADGDGLTDSIDKCPSQPGKVSDNGCPKTTTGAATQNTAWPWWYYVCGVLFVLAILAGGGAAAYSRRKPVTTTNVTNVRPANADNQNVVDMQADNS